MKIFLDALVMPLEGSMSQFCAGVFDKDRNFVEGCLNYRGRAAEYREPEEIIDEPCIYAGCLFGHFGHFIWESLARLAAIRKCKEYPLIFISPNPGILDGQIKMLRAIGVKNGVILIKKPTQFGRLIYDAPQSSLEPLNLTDEWLAGMASINTGDTLNGKKIWLSRSRLKTGKITNEEVIERVLRKRGFDIIHPEELGFHAQIGLIANSNIVAGFDGSQFYASLFAKKVLGKFFVFNRRPSPARAISYALERKKITHRTLNFPVELMEGDPKNAGANYKALAIDGILATLLA